MALLGDIKIMLLKGDKGDKGDGSYDDTEIKQMINDEAVARETEIAELEAHFLEYLYPVGSIYMSAGNTSPAILFGGTWEKIEGKFLLGSSSNYNLGATGGEATHILSIQEMGGHSHKYSNFAAYSHGDGLVSLKWDKIGDMVSPTETDYNLVPAHGATGQVTSGSTSINGGTDYETTSPHNNMPPYLVVNVWKRTA